MRHNKKILYAFFVILLAGIILACGTTTPKASMAGKWLDPDTSGTITTIEANGSGFAVGSVTNSDRGVNQLTVLQLVKRRADLDLLPAGYALHRLQDKIRNGRQPRRRLVVGG